jgi:hypothetical protein
LRLAYLILAHEQPEQLARLVDRILDEDAHVFIHVDKKTNIRPFLDALGHIPNPWKKTNLHLAARRRKVAYFGFSTVEATLTLMKQASGFGSFSRYTLLSGADYPIRTNSEIRDILSANRQEFIAYWRIDDRPSWRHKLEHYFLTDLVPVRNLKRPRLRRFWRIHQSLPYLFWSAFNRHRHRFPIRRYPFPELVPYGGSQWWSLTDECVRYLLDFVDKRRDVVRFFRYVQCPDEMFFQTILMNSPFAERAANFDRYRRWSEERKSDPDALSPMLEEMTFNLRYIDWTGPYGGERGYPYVLDERDFDELKSSVCLFARKFDAQKSSRLLDRIDTEILGRPHAPDSNHPSTNLSPSVRRSGQ